MSEAKKQEKDFTPEVEALVKEANDLAKKGSLPVAVEKLLALEKQARNASDLKSTNTLATTIVRLSYEAHDLAQVNANITLLTKKHGQFKATTQAVVEQAVEWMDEIRQKDGLEKWLELVETLRQVTEGKIFLETPRARVTLQLSRYHESLANEPTKAAPDSLESIATASELLSDLQVETYSSMNRKEKTEFILEQMRLLVLVARRKEAADQKEKAEADWIKVRVGGRKVNESFLKEEGNEVLKYKYYELMIQFALHDKEYLDAAKYYHNVWETPAIKSDTTGKGKTALEHVVYYVILSPYNNEQSDMLHRITLYPEIQKLELLRDLLRLFGKKEIMRWTGIQSLYGSALRNTDVFGPQDDEEHWKDLHVRIIEHNIRVVAGYYTRISLKRLQEMLDLSDKETEDTLSRLVVSKSVWARIDRPAGIVNFRKQQTAEDVCNEWSHDMQRLLGLVEKTWMGMNAALAAQSRVKA